MKRGMAEIEKYLFFKREKRIEIKIADLKGMAYNWVSPRNIQQGKF